MASVAAPAVEGCESQHPAGRPGGPDLGLDPHERPEDAACGEALRLVFRHSLQVRLTRALAPAARVLVLGCGPGEQALSLADAGWAVLGLDPAPAVIEAAREKARRQGLPAERLRFEVAAIEEVGGPLWEHGTFGAACSDFGTLNTADLALLGEGLRRILCPGAPLLLSLVGARPLPVLVARAVVGRDAGERGAATSAGAVAYPSRREAQELLGPGFLWHGGFALGVLLPAADRAGWIAEHPQAFGVLAALEGLVRHWPLFRDLGAQTVLEGRRR